MSLHLAGLTCRHCGDDLGILIDDLEGDGGGDDTSLLVIPADLPLGVIPDPLYDHAWIHSRHLDADEVDDVTRYYQGLWEALDVLEASS